MAQKKSKLKSKSNAQSSVGLPAKVELPKKPKKSKIKKTDLQKMLDRKRFELSTKEDFIKKLNITIDVESSKVSELKGAILTLHEILTGEKVE